MLKCFSNTKVIFVHISEEGRPKRKLKNVNILFYVTSTFMEAR